MLKLSNLTATLEGKQILKGVDLDIHNGEIHVLLGPNGSGKSTLGRTLIGDPRIAEVGGSVSFNGEDFLAMEPHERAQAGFFLSFQSPPELDGISAKELLLAAKKAPLPEDEVISALKFTRELESNLETMRLGDEFIHREMNKGASGGERRKMEMVALKTLDPQVAFLDEIDSGIDVDALRAIADGVQDFMAKENKALVLVSHGEKLLQLVKPTHAHILVKGKIVKSGGPELIEEIHQDGFDAYLPKASDKLKVI